MTSSRNKSSKGKKLAGEPTASVSQQRRRLIKGAAAAAPGIFTLYSGNAQAMLSTYQCNAATRDAFTGNEEFAGEEKLADGFARLAETTTNGIVVRNVRNSSSGDERWLIEVDGKFFEAGHTDTATGTSWTGASWNDVLNSNKEWVRQGSSNNFKDPVTGDVFAQDESQAPAIQLLACVDDNGIVVSASPQQCNNLGLTPTSGSCWASVA